MENGDIKKSNGQWINFVSLKEYTDKLITDLCQKINNQFDDRDKATESAYRSMEKRLDGMNEFRESLREAQATYTTRREHEALIEKYDESFNELKESISKIQNELTGITVKIWIIISIGSVLAIWFVTHLAGQI